MTNVRPSSLTSPPPTTTILIFISEGKRNGAEPAVRWSRVHFEQQEGSRVLGLWETH